MSRMAHPKIQNRLLAVIPENFFRKLVRELEPTNLNEGEYLFYRDEPAR